MGESTKRDLNSPKSLDVFDGLPEDAAFKCCWKCVEKTNIKKF